MKNLIKSLSDIIKKLVPLISTGNVYLASDLVRRSKLINNLGSKLESYGGAIPN
jgi:hypothetical protein